MNLETRIAECTTYDFKVMLASTDMSDGGDNYGDMSKMKLTECQKIIRNFIKEFPTITGKQLSETLSVSQRTIERDLSALKELKILKREGKDNDGVCILLKRIGLLPNFSYNQIPPNNKQSGI